MKTKIKLRSQLQNLNNEVCSIKELNKVNNKSFIKKNFHE